jgi:hypothetical protein
MYRSHNGTLLASRGNLPEYVPSVSDCVGPKTAFAGAFFCSVRTLLGTSFPDAMRVEESSGYTMFRRGGERPALKTTTPEAFAVEHLSGFEWWILRQYRYNASNREAIRILEAAATRSVRAACAPPAAAEATARGSTGGAAARGSTRAVAPGTLALVPFWGGFGLLDGGMAHSSNSGTVRSRHLQATLCSLHASGVQTIVVGACVDWSRPQWDGRTDAQRVAALVRDVPHDAPLLAAAAADVHVLPMMCEKGTHLNARLLRYAQARLRGEWPGSEPHGSNTQCMHSQAHTHT